MALSEKINLKRYFLFSCFINLLLIYLFAANLMETLVFLGVGVAIYVNNALLGYFVGQILTKEKNKSLTRAEAVKRFGFLLLKVSALGISIGVGVHFIGDKIIIPLLNYLVHIFIFIFCLKRS